MRATLAPAESVAKILSGSSLNRPSQSSRTFLLIPECRRNVGHPTGTASRPEWSEARIITLRSTLAPGYSGSPHGTLRIRSWFSQGSHAVRFFAPDRASALGILGKQGSWRVDGERRLQARWMARPAAAELRVQCQQSNSTRAEGDASAGSACFTPR